MVKTIFIDFEDTNENLYRLNGLLDWYCSLLTDADTSNIQFLTSEWDFGFTKEIVILCLQNTDNLQRCQWEFLSNGKYPLYV